MDEKSPQQFYLMTPCDHTDRHYMPFSIMAKLLTHAGKRVTGIDYLTIELYDEYDTYYLFLSTSLRKYIPAVKAVSTLYDENAKQNVPWTTLKRGDTVLANGKFNLWMNNDERQNSFKFKLTHIPTGCKQEVHMKWQGRYNWKGNNRWGMHYASFSIPTCYRCSTCGVLGDFQHKCKDPKVFGCSGQDVDIRSARNYRSASWDVTGWTWQKSLKSDACPARAAGFQQELDTYCNPDLENEVMEKCQIARDKMKTCCRNIGGEFCDELQDDCKTDTCIMASDDYSKMDEVIKDVFTDEVEEECMNRGMMGPVPKLLYEFRGNLKESMSDGDAKYDLQSAGDVKVEDGALVCDGDGDYVWSTQNIDFTFTAHSLEVLVELDSLEEEGGGTISIDGMYMDDGMGGAMYSHWQFDSIVYNEVGNNKKWILGSEYFSRTNTEGTTTAESEVSKMVHLVAVWDPNNFDGSSAKLYRNGKQEMAFDSGAFLTSMTPNDGLRMMFCQQHMNAEGKDFKGKIMYGAIYDFALADQDVEQLFTQTIVEFDLDGVKNVVEAIGDELLPGQSLLKGQGLFSVDKRYIAALKEDGMFIIFDTEEKDIEFGAEMEKGSYGKYGTDGNFVIYNDAGNAVWHTGVTDAKPHNLLMATNGKLLAFGDDSGVYWRSNRHETVALSAASPGTGIVDVHHNGLDGVNTNWRLKVDGPNGYSPTETYILYVCAVLILVNVICCALYCYNNRSHGQYKVVSVMTTAAEETTDLDTDVDDT